MGELTLDDVDASLGREGDWTVRFKNLKAPSPKKYIFGYLHFDGNRDTWAITFFLQNRKIEFEFYGNSYLEVKQMLTKKIPEYLNNKYNISALTSGYDMPPWLTRKR